LKDIVKTVVVQGSTGGLEDKEKNIAHVLDNVRKYGPDNDLIVFPELVIQGYVREKDYNFEIRYWEAAETLPGPTTDLVAQLAKECNCYVAFGIAEKASTPGCLYNSIALVGPEGFVGSSRKMHLAFIEKDYFLLGEESNVFDTALGKIGLMICYDLFFPETARILALKGAEIIVHIAAAMGGGKRGGVGLSEDKRRFFDTAGVCRAIENQVHYVGGDRVGEHYMGPKLGTWSPMGLAKIVNNYGVILAQAKYGEEDVIFAELTNKDLVEGRSVYPLLLDRNPKNYKRLTQYEM
jgi:predicted amidohydrolase